MACSKVSCRVVYEVKFVSGEGVTVPYFLTDQPLFVRVRSNVGLLLLAHAAFYRQSGRHHIVRGVAM